jgi:hypothetical protein
LNEPSYERSQRQRDHSNGTPLAPQRYRLAPLSTSRKITGPTTGSELQFINPKPGAQRQGEKPMKKETCGFINVRNLTWPDYWTALDRAQSYQATSKSMAALAQALLEAYAFSDQGAHYIEASPAQTITLH